MVRALHDAGLDVIMHVPLARMGEGTDAAPDSQSLRGIDAPSYFRVNSGGGLDTVPGHPGSTALNPCSVHTQRLVLDALRHWALAGRRRRRRSVNPVFSGTW